VIAQESGGNPFAVRYEPAFYKKYVESVTPANIIGYLPKSCSFVTEKNARATSWGLMQIMGQVARERGFKGEFLSELTDPINNLNVGISFFKHLLDLKGSKEAALLRYNGGGDPKYAEKVLAHIDSDAVSRLLYS
jgi:soluble lytic murein transglycosylase-like protein